MSDYFLNKIYDSLLSRKPVPKKPEPIVEKKESFKPLSKVYEILLREVEHVAIYGSKDDVDPKNIPDRSAQGLEVLGVASQEVAKRVKRQLNVQTSNIEELLGKYFELKNIPSKKKRPKVFALVYNALENSDISNPQAVIEALLTPQTSGQFNIISKTSPYNCLNAAVQSLLQHPKIKEANIDEQSLMGFLKTILPEDEGMASTSVGPGELFFALFSNARVAGDEGKSGDLEVDGNKIELKATKTDGARLGGTTNIVDGPNKILKDLQLNYRTTAILLNTKLKALNELLNAVQKAQTDQISPEEAFNNLKTEAKRIIISSMGKLGQVNYESLYKSKFEKPINSINTPVYTDFKPNTGSTKLPTFINRYRAFIEDQIQETQNNIKEYKSTDIRKGRLDEFLYNVLEQLKLNPNTTFDQIVKTIAGVNSYVAGYEGMPINIETEIKTYLTSKGITTPEQIYSAFLDGNITPINKLIGGMHLLSYMSIIKSNTLILLNANSGNTIVAKAPANLSDAINICNLDGVVVDTSVDKPGGKTPRGLSVKLVVNE